MNLFKSFTLIVLGSLAFSQDPILNIDPGTITFTEKTDGTYITQLGLDFQLHDGIADQSRITFLISQNAKSDDVITILPDSGEPGLTLDKSYIELKNNAVIFNDEITIDGEPVTTSLTIGELKISYGGSLGYIRFNGNSNEVRIKKAISRISFYSPSDDPTSDPRNIELTFISGNNLTSNTEDITLYCSEINDKPVSSAISYPLIGRQEIPLRDTPFTARLPVRDVDNNDLSITLVNYPNHGTVNFSDDGFSFTYNPETNYIGDDTFSFIAYDGIEYSDIGNVSLTISEINTNDYFFSTTQRTPLFGNLQDVYPGKKFNIINGPSLGNLRIESNNSFVYTPINDNFGTDSIILETISDSDAVTRIPMQVTIGKLTELNRPIIISTPLVEEQSVLDVFTYDIITDVAGIPSSTPVSLDFSAYNIDSKTSIPLTRLSGTSSTLSLTIDNTLNNIINIRLFVRDPKTKSCDTQDIQIIKKTVSGSAG